MHRLDTPWKAQQAFGILPYFEIVKLLQRLFGKLAQSPEETREQSIRRWAADIEGIVPIAEAKSRENVRVAGVVQTLRIDPREGSGSIDAKLTDGTGEVVARWLGRQALAGIQLGAALVMEGMIGTSSDGEQTILNPQYDLVEGPGHR
jgi:hypothetical protein